MNKVLRTIKKLMESKGYSENELAERSSVPQSTINSLSQTNYMPSLDTLLKLCIGLEISPSEFFKIYESDLMIEDDENKEYELSLANEDIMNRIQHKLLLLSKDEKLLIEDLIDKIIK